MTYRGQKEEEEEEEEHHKITNICGWLYINYQLDALIIIYS